MFTKITGINIEKRNKTNINVREPKSAEHFQQTRVVLNMIAIIKWHGRSASSLDRSKHSVVTMQTGGRWQVATEGSIERQRKASVGGLQFVPGVETAKRKEMQ